MAPLVRRTWNPRGSTPILLQRTRSHRKVSAIAALCVSPERNQVQLCFRLHPDTSIDATLVRDFLRQLRRQLDGPMVVVWDRLSAHQARKVRALLDDKQDIHLCFLPAYAPELNPVEYLWCHLKMNPLANRPVMDVVELSSVARHHGRSLQHKEELLRSFIRHSPLSLRLR